MPCLSLRRDGQKSSSHSVWGTKPQDSLLAAPRAGAASVRTWLQVVGLGPPFLRGLLF